MAAFVDVVDVGVGIIGVAEEEGNGCEAVSVSVFGSEVPLDGF